MCIHVRANISSEHANSKDFIFELFCADSMMIHAQAERQTLVVSIRKVNSNALSQNFRRRKKLTFECKYTVSSRCATTTTRENEC